MAKKIPKEKIAGISDMHAQGISYTSIAETISVNVRTVREYIVAFENGYDTPASYQKARLQLRGFSRRIDYQNHLARQKGFEKYSKYLDANLMKKGETTRATYLDRLAKENGFETHTERLNADAKARGFESRTKLLEHLVQKRGFDTLPQYQKHLATTNGYSSHAHYKRELRKTNAQLPENRALANAVTMLLHSRKQHIFWLAENLNVSDATAKNYFRGTNFPSKKHQKILFPLLGIKSVEDLIQKYGSSNSVTK